jgi:FAD:protein FMN transferase
MKKNEMSKLISQFNSYQRVNRKTGYLYFSYAMGTLITQKINGLKLEAKEVTNETLEMIDKLDKMMSFFSVTSQLSQINQQAGKLWVSIDPELFFLIKEAKKYACLTEGFFDITIANLVKIWQDYGKLKQVPPQSLIEDTLKKVGYKNILIDEERGMVKLCRIGQKIDLGGIAKGYVANRVIQYYQQKGLFSAMINLGGNVALLGERDDGKPWQIGIQSPFKERNQCLATVSVCNTSVVTSGDYERFFSENNRIYHHILNPLTGYPASSGLRSVTIIHPDAMLADVLATTLFILGLTKGVKLLKRFSDIEVIMISENRKIYLSKSLVGKFQITEKGFSLFQI